VPDLATLEHQALIWPGFTPHWPSAGPGFAEQFTPMAAWGLPAVNTILLLSSGVTVTFAHWNLIANNRGKLLVWLGATVALGVAFLVCQGIEYHHAFTELNLTLHTGVYGSTFFMLTGFHGFHVTIGAIMLTVIWFRCLRGHFKPDHHFAFEGVAWYWHFVDVVWLGSLSSFTGSKACRNQAEVVAGHQHQEEGHRKTDAKRERLHHALSCPRSRNMKTAAEARLAMIASSMAITT
jgi:cytochrome c oxidase subunit 3